MLQVKHVEYMSEKCRSTAVRSSTSVKVAVTESLFMAETIPRPVVIDTEMSVHWKHIFLVFS